MRFTLLSAEPLDVAHGSGTAMAVMRLRSALAAQGVSVPVVGPRRRGGSHTLRRLHFNRALRERRFFEVDALLGLNGDGWELAENGRVPYVVLVKAMYRGAARYEHGMTRALLMLQARWERRGAAAASVLIAPSRFTANAVIAHYGVEPRRVRVVPEPFDVEGWQQGLPRFVRRGNRVLCVAHLYPRKRVQDLIDAWPLVRAVRSDAQLHIAGDGPELRRLVHRARGIDGCYLHGFVAPRDLPPFYARADVFCLPSGQETFGYAAVEAMASGLPLVVAESGALPEVTAGAVVNAVPEGDIGALAEALLDCLSAEARQAAAPINVERVRQYAPERVIPLFIEAVTGRS